MQLTNISYGDKPFDTGPDTEISLVGVYYYRNGYTLEPGATLPTTWETIVA